MSTSKEERVKLNGLFHPSAKIMKVTGKPESHQFLDLVLILRPKISTEKLPDENDHQKIENRNELIIVRKEFDQKFGAHLNDIELVKNFAIENNFEVRSVNSVERSIHLRGSVQSIEDAFKIEIFEYKIRSNIYLFYEGTISVPKKLKNVIESLLGINNEPILAKKVLPKEIRLSNMGFEGEAVLPRFFEELYNFPKDLDGSNQCIAILEFGGGYEDKYIEAYFDKLGIPTPDISYVELDGCNKPNDIVPNVFEVYMDLEIIGSLAPGAKIIVYFAEDSPKGFSNAIRAAVHDSINKPDIISISWGINEGEWKQKISKKDSKSLHRILQEAALLNITIISSTGDLGSSGLQDGAGLNVELPASSPFVLAVGGTEIYKEDNIVIREDVWAQVIFKKQKVSSGGGFSKFHKMPRYQKKEIPKKFKSYKNRGVPDVAANASTWSGILIYVKDLETISWGTSAAVPLWAALIARINQGLESQGLPNAGFINPFLYHNELSAAFNQVTEGSNGEYFAGPGWNPCTGLGTPNGTVLLDLLTKLNQKHHDKTV